MSLVEIMVVIAIIGVLMTVLAVNVVSKLDEANADATRIQMTNIKNELIMYAAKHQGKYPSTGDGLAALKKQFPNGEVPKDAWGGEFAYFSPGTHGDHDFEIVSYGKDGKEGGDDADADITSWTE
jgi:general secretion pathway protein G